MTVIEFLLQQHKICLCPGELHTSLQIKIKAELMSGCELIFSGIKGLEISQASGRDEIVAGKARPGAESREREERGRPQVRTRSLSNYQSWENQTDVRDWAMEMKSDK